MYWDRNWGKACLFQISLATGSVRVFPGSHRQTLLEGFLPAVSRQSDKYESTLDRRAPQGGGGVSRKRDGREVDGRHARRAVYEQDRDWVEAISDQMTVNKVSCALVPSDVFYGL